MENILGVKIAEAREKMKLTQDQFGARYGVSGPAVFKFEKGYVKPSLDLWLKMAHDSNLGEKKAVLMWIKAKLPREFQSFIEMSATGVSESAPAYGTAEQPNYARMGDPSQIRQKLLDDAALPPGMKAMFGDPGAV
jgi:DNA-binding XRE family transcriptional regulator